MLLNTSAVVSHDACYCALKPHDKPPFLIPVSVSAFIMKLSTDILIVKSIRHRSSDGKTATLLDVTDFETCGSAVSDTLEGKTC